jgi:D-beta-D-heptose 7-phosphate kinase/D-beta-D-heptose 1-phosphate adenosyltransferase
MKPPTLPRSSAQRFLAQAARLRILVVGDAMLDQFLWGRVSRISPEAPVPVVDFERESFMPGGAANVARNLAALGIGTRLFGVTGKDAHAAQLRALLAGQGIGCSGLLQDPARSTSVKTRIVAGQQQVVRVDRENREDVAPARVALLLRRIEAALNEADAVIVGDYGKGVVTQSLLDGLRKRCRARGVWVSLDPKPTHPLDLARLSLITPNRKELFELAGLPDTTRQPDPLRDTHLMRAAESVLTRLEPALLLVTLGELGMLLCQRHAPPFHIPTVAQEVFDVSGAGDTVISTFTLAIAAGASPLEAALFANQAAGIVVGKVGTATVSPQELLACFKP